MWTTWASEPHMLYVKWKQEKETKEQIPELRREGKVVPSPRLKTRSFSSLTEYNEGNGNFIWHVLILKLLHIITLAEPINVGLGRPAGWIQPGCQRPGDFMRGFSTSWPPLSLFIKRDEVGGIPYLLAPWAYVIYKQRCLRHILNVSLKLRGMMSIWFSLLHSPLSAPLPPPQHSSWLIEVPDF